MSYLHIILAVAALQGQAGPENRKGKSSFSAVLSGSVSGDFSPISVVRRPSDHEIARAIPKRATSAVRVWWNCSARPNGRLNDCSVLQIWPQDLDKASLTRTIVPKIQLSQSELRTHLKPDSRVSLEVYLDDVSRQLDHSCPPGWCPETLEPPKPKL